MNQASLAGPEGGHDEQVVELALADRRHLGPSECLDHVGDGITVAGNQDDLAELPGQYLLGKYTRLLRRRHLLRLEAESIGERLDGLLRADELGK